MFAGLAMGGERRAAMAARLSEAAKIGVLASIALIDGLLYLYMLVPQA